MAWLKIKDARRYVGGFDERIIRRWMADGLRHARLPSGRILIEEAALDEYLKKFEKQKNVVDEIVEKTMKELRNGRE